MNKLDFTDPQAWTFQATVILNPSADEEYADFQAMMLDDIADACNASGGDCWGVSDALDAVRGSDSRFENRHTCDHCGAAFNYGAAFKNGDQIAVVGHTCATSTLQLSAPAYARKNAEKIVKAARTKAKNAAREARLCKNRREALQAPHHIVQDMRGKFHKWGSLSVKQWALAKKIRDDRQPTADEPTAPVVEGAIVITGAVLCVKVQESYYGDQIKMLVRDDRGFKVWGSVPVALEDANKGDRVEFTANVTGSSDDESFGFFKRPRKASIKSDQLSS